MMKADVLSLLAAALLGVFLVVPATAQRIETPQEQFLRSSSSHEERTHVMRGLDELTATISCDGAGALVVPSTSVNEDVADTVSIESESDSDKAGSEITIGKWTVLDLGENESESPNSKFAHLLEPASGTSPSCIIFFLSGGVPMLSHFPEVFYKAFLERLMAKTNAAIVAIPYEAGTDHSAIALKAVRDMKNALTVLENERGYFPSLPKYAIGHSGGAKMHAIGIATTDIGKILSGVGLMGYNDFSMAETVSSAMTFTMEMGVGGSSESSATQPTFLFNLASMAASALGLEFKPSPSEVDQMLQTGFSEDHQKKTMLFQFQTDDFDSTPKFMANFVANEAGPSVSIVPGTHMTPTFMACERTTISDEDDLNSLLNEVSSWMLDN
ncbi:hypothetical protein ACHAWF_012232 [Thalassiosira exigua]